MKQRRLAVIGGTAILAFLAIVTENFAVAHLPQRVLGVLLVFVLPGFGLVCAVLPGAEITSSERLLASLGTSLAVTTCSAVLLGATVGLSQRTIATALGCITLVASACAWHRT